MKKIAIISQKGGAGKTTLTVHLASAAAAAGYSVAVVDLDPQATAANWSDWRADENPVVITAPHARLAQVLERAEKSGVEIVFFDTPPAADSAAVAAAKAADLVIVPTRSSAFDLHAVKTTAELLRVSRTPAYAMLNAVPVNAPRMVEETVALVVSMGLAVAPVCLPERAAFRHSVVSGQTAAEYEPGGKAAADLNRVYEWLCGVMDMSTRPQVNQQVA